MRGPAPPGRLWAHRAAAWDPAPCFVWTHGCHAAPSMSLASCRSQFSGRALGVREFGSCACPAAGPPESLAAEILGELGRGRPSGGRPEDTHAAGQESEPGALPSPARCAASLGGFQLQEHTGERRVTPLTCHTQGCFYFCPSFQLQPLCRWAS